MWLVLNRQVDPGPGSSPGAPWGLLGAAALVFLIGGLAFALAGLVEWLR